jgi:hypothetical protein
MTRKSYIYWIYYYFEKGLLTKDEAIILMSKETWFSYKVREKIVPPKSTN